jgi:predicted molibdopterin-dependent oxidoreductase YjgC
VGCEITLHHKSGFMMRTTGKDEGLVNKHGSICRFPKFGYHHINDNSRLTKPLLKKDGEFKEISFDEAYKIMAGKIKAVDRNENAFFAGARLSNEELYMIQKFARAAVKTNNVDSFHYLGRGEGYRFDTWMNTPFQEIQECSKIWLMGAELNTDHAVVGFMVNKARTKHQTPVAMITKMPDSHMKHKVDEITNINNYYYFVRAANYLMVENNLVNEMFVNDRTRGYQQYQDALMKEDLNYLLEKAGISREQLWQFVKEFNDELNAILIAEEKHLPANAMAELRNLMLLTGKLGKTAMGLISLREKNNSQGLLDMGIGRDFGVGTAPVGKDQILNDKMAVLWKQENLPDDIGDPLDKQLEEAKIMNLFIFGEDPVGCAMQKEEISNWLDNADFVMVQDYFITETAQMADLIMPASLPHETGGSFTNAEKKIQTFEKHDMITPKVQHDNVKQLCELHNAFGLNGINEVHDAFMEAVSLLPTTEEARNINFLQSAENEDLRMFNHGCDYLVKRFEESFNEKLSS